MFGDVREEAICQTLAKRLGAVWLRAATSSPQLPPFSKRAWHTARAQSATHPARERRALEAVGSRFHVAGGWAPPGKGLWTTRDADDGSLDAK